MFFESIWRSNFLIRLRNWEYWPFLVVYWPVFIYWFYLAAKARSFFYFSASNPGIENGGMLGESKIKILDSLPSKLIPQTTYIKHEDKSLSEVIATLIFPVICKPDIGERGWKVEKINNAEELINYHEEITVDYLIQEYLTEEIELGIFYYRYPSQKSGVISSIVAKEMLTLKGDGKSTLKELISKYDRAKLQCKTLELRYKNRLNEIVKEGESIHLVYIGNHSRGTKFLDANHLINSELVQLFDDIARNINGFYFGRFDIKVHSIEDLYQGKLKIMELNGAGSEPAHIYNPGYSLWNAYKVIFHHWKVLFEISMENHKKGIPFMTLKEAWREYKKTRAVGT
ncbi:ATP-grasp domain-containing protein [Fulvivirga lutea]|uniref:ATP-grasp domain-containing protein n=1 Tax=Fulvivirga lutea TaxID=2810512 RepID=A0A975A289_9BACT|nr:hypothetical protein [Fulvivirga lutea]QSE98591.1 hypothetical protein JR347_05795 [Fulvivirga lutea]